MATQSIARPFTASLPQPMFRPLTEPILAPVVAAMAVAAQAIDDSREPVAFELWPGYLRARVAFIARGAVRACHEQVQRDAQLKARGALAQAIFALPFDQLNSAQQNRIFHATRETVSAFQRHIEGVSGDLLPSERESLMVKGEL